MVFGAERQSGGAVGSQSPAARGPRSDYLRPAKPTAANPFGSIGAAGHGRGAHILRLRTTTRCPAGSSPRGLDRMGVLLPEAGKRPYRAADPEARHALRPARHRLGMPGLRGWICCAFWSRRGSRLPKVLVTSGYAICSHAWRRPGRSPPLRSHSTWRLLPQQSGRHFRGPLGRASNVFRCVPRSAVTGDPKGAGRHPWAHHHVDVARSSRLLPPSIPRLAATGEIRAFVQNPRSRHPRHAPG